MNEANVEKKRLENPPQTIDFRISRREKLGAAQYTETFSIPYRKNLNVISALMEIRKNPITKDGKKQSQRRKKRASVAIAIRPIV